MRQRDIYIRDSVFNPSSDSKDVHHFPSEGKTVYKVWLYLDGVDIHYVRRVKYILHKTFRNRYLTIQRKPSNVNCQLAIWTWGIFTVFAEVTCKDGSVLHLEHKLEYDKCFGESGVKFIQV